MIPLSDASRRPARGPAVTTFLIAINVAAFGLELVGGNAFVLGGTPPAEIASGCAWMTMLTAMFLHGGVMHILGNMCPTAGEGSQTRKNAAMPEEFPIVLTLFLSVGAWRLASRGMLVRRLASVE